MHDIEKILGKDSYLLTHTCKTILKERIYQPSPNFIDEVTAQSDRSGNVLKNLAFLLKSGRLKDTGYVNILPVDQKATKLQSRTTVPQTDTGGQDENSKALERTQEKELGKLTP